MATDEEKPPEFSQDAFLAGENAFASVEARQNVVRVLQKTPQDRTEPEVNRLVVLIEGVKFFDKLGVALKRELCRVMTYEPMGALSTVFHEGDMGDKFYIILHGSVEIRIRDESGASERCVSLSSGDSFGELALVKDAPRAATVVCAEACEFLTVVQRDYARILKYIHDNEIEERAKFLANIPIFNGWSHAHLVQLGSIMLVKHYPKNKLIVKQGDKPIDGMFFIKHGDCRIIKEVDFFLRRREFTNGDTQRAKAAKEDEAAASGGEGGDKGEKPPKVVKKLLEIGTLGPREFFGEVALLNKEGLRACSVVSSSPVECYTLGKNDFNRRFTGKTLELLRDHVARYPQDDDLKAAFKQQRTWESYKKSLVDNILKEKRLRNRSALEYRS